MKGLNSYQRTVLERINAPALNCNEVCDEAQGEPCELDDVPQTVLDSLTIRGLITWQQCKFDEHCFHYFITPTGRILLSVTSELEAG